MTDRLGLSSDALQLDESEVQERYFERGWTDGLPIVPPTPPRVAALLAYAGVAPEQVIGEVPERQRTITCEKAAINAVMAGCRPEYFPVVLAGLSAMCDPAFNVNTAITSTGGAALCLTIAGPQVKSLGFYTRHNALGAGNRANATIGRTMRLVAMNVLGARTPGMDGSSIGNPGKYSLVLAEDEVPPTWAPLNVELGYDEGDTTVTIMATEGPRQIANHLNGDPVGLLTSFAATIKCPTGFTVGKGGQFIVVVGHEHRTILVEAGWTKTAIRAWLVEHTRITPDELLSAGVLLEVGAQHDMTPGPDGKLPTVRRPGDLLVVAAGGAGAGWSAYLPAWAPDLHSKHCTRRVMPPGGGLPDR